MELKHFGQVKNGAIVYDDNSLYKSKIRSLEGKRCCVVIKEVSQVVSTNQYAYYFGYVIGTECANIEIFSGWNRTDIHEYLWNKLRPGITFSSRNKKMLADYIEELIPYLSEKYGIYVKADKHFSKIIS